jgi:ATP-dependent protease ClpP protease subunit
MADDPDKPDTDKPDSDSGSAKSGKSLSDAGVKYLCSDITGSACKDIIEWILEENMINKRERLTLMISSYGGEVYAAFALIDAMMGSKIPVNTVGLGYIASAGLSIFIYGAHRVITQNTYILAHQYSGFRIGKQHELIAGRKEEDWLKERFIDMYTRRSKLSREQVSTLLLGPSDTFLTAKEALEYGLADEIRL